MPLRLLFAGCALGLLAACGGSSEGDGSAAATPPPSLTPIATAVATGTPGTPSATATPAAPIPTATAPPLEPTATTGALPVEQLPLIEFVRADGTVAALPTEVPPRDEYGIGLSGRYELGARGMLFHYPDEGLRGFYMNNTHVDLDIAFVGADLEIQEILRMEAESLEIRRPAESYQYAIEAPAGWYEANGVEVGDLARFVFDLADFS